MASPIRTVHRRLDSYSMMIIMKYLRTKNDFRNVINVCKKYQEIIDMFRFNPIPINNNNFFCNIQTQYIYSPNDVIIPNLFHYVVWHTISYDVFVNKQNNITYKNVVFTRENMLTWEQNHPENCIKSEQRDNVGLTMVDVDDKLRKIDIPDNIHHLGFCCFEECRKLTHVSVSKQVLTIGNYCFRDCRELSSIQLPHTLSSIGEKVFSRCFALSSIKLAHALKRLGGYSFYECKSLKEISIPPELTYIEEQCFYGCSSLTSLTLHNNVSLSNDCFDNCKKLNEIHIPKCTFFTCSIPYWMSRLIRDNVVCTNVIFTQEDTKIYLQPNPLVSDINNLVEDSKLNFNSLHHSQSITSIGSHCFDKLNFLTTIILPDGLINIQDSAFSKCIALSTIYLPTSLKHIGNYSFYGCNELQEIVFPDDIQTIGNSCFANCVNLSKLVLSNSISSIGSNTFYCCSSLSDISLNKGNIFYGTLPLWIVSKLKSNGIQCNNVEFTRDDLQLWITQHIANNSSQEFLKTITIPTTVNRISAQCFVDCISLSSIIIPDSVTEIGSECFAGCTSLSYLKLPSTIKCIRNDCFLFCRQLLSIDIVGCKEFYPTIPYYIALSLQSKGIHCYNVEFTTVDHELWKNEHPMDVDLHGDLVKIQIPDIVCSIGRHCFYDCGSLTQVRLPTTITNIEDEAFEGCESLTNLTLPPNIIHYGQSCFHGCEELMQNMDVPDQCW